MYLAAFGLAGTMFNVVAFGYGKGHSPVELKFLFGVAFACGAYYGICTVVVKSSQISAAVWRQPASCSVHR
jgi:hypothetical protein